MSAIKRKAENDPSNLSNDSDSDCQPLIPPKVGIAGNYPGPDPKKMRHEGPTPCSITPGGKLPSPLAATAAAAPSPCLSTSPKAKVKPPPRPVGGPVAGVVMKKSSQLTAASPPVTRSTTAKATVKQAAATAPKAPAKAGKLTAATTTTPITATATATTATATTATSMLPTGASSGPKRKAKQPPKTASNKRAADAAAAAAAAVVPAPSSAAASSSSSAAAPPPSASARKEKAVAKAATAKTAAKAKAKGKAKSKAKSKAKAKPKAKTKAKAVERPPADPSSASASSEQASPQAPQGVAIATAATAAADQVQLGRFTRSKLPIMSEQELATLTVPFDEISNRLRGVLDELGVAVVTDVARPAEIERLDQLFQDDLRDLLDVEAAKVAGPIFQAAAEETLKSARQLPLASLAALGPMERCQRKGLSHGRFAWEARLLPRIREVYRLLHGTEDLVTSCDNSFFAPDAHRKEASNKATLHVDQNKHDDRFKDEKGRSIGDWECFQSILYVWSSAAERASTTVVWPKSHTTIWNRIMADNKVMRAGLRGSHFTMVSGLQNAEEVGRIFSEWQNEARRLPLPAGSLLLWNSKLVHQAWRGGPRLAQPVCWEPRSRRTEEARERKLRLAALGLPSTHWASLGLPHSMLQPNKLEQDVRTPAQKEKAGLQLPMHQALRPRTLSDTAEVNALWERLGTLPWEEPLPADVKQLLEESIREEYKKHL